MKSEQKVCVIAGFTEGSHHTRRFIQAVRNAGLDITNDPVQASIIVTHSAGCFLLPSDTSSKLIVLASPPCEYSDSIFKNTLRKVGIDYKAHRELRRLRHFIHKTGWSSLYFFTHTKRHREMLRHMPHSVSNLPMIQARKTVVIGTKDDPWSSRISHATITRNTDYIFINMNATHDDIWMHPERYVAIIQSTYES